MTRTQKETDTVPPTISPEDIAQRAYALYILRGAEHGHDVEDWLQAERELREEKNAAEAA